MNTPPRTLIEFLNAARDYLEGKSVDNARGDAEALLGRALGLPRLQIYLQHDRPLKPDEVARYRELLARRGKREPLQLILGTVEFCGVPIAVSPGLLIPRPETEELAMSVIEWAQAQDNAQLRVLDIGTGTGCVAVAIAAQVPRAMVDAADVDFEAVKCAVANAQRNRVADRVCVLRADFLSPRFLASVQPPYDAVVSNPPYVAEADYRTLPPEIREYESKRALVAGDDGLTFYRRMAEVVPALLRPGGFLAVEVAYNQAEPVEKILSGVLGEIGIKNDLSGVPRIVCGVNMEEEPSQLRAS